MRFERAEQVEAALRLGLITERQAADLKALIAWRDSGIPVDVIPTRPDGSLMTPDEWRALVDEFVARAFGRQPS